MNNIDTNKIMADIADLENKKQMLLLSLQHDIDEIDKDVMKEFREIGQRAYSLAFEGEGNLSALKADFDKIDAFKAEQDAKDKKKGDIIARYDEEIEIMRKLLPQKAEESAPVETASTPAETAPAPPIDPANMGFCTNCGKAYALGGDMFCLQCGTKLG
ncbi:MAG: hypothetical protein FWG45_07465 [Oscillospiraceae bacterium]|nr:hypothetical protein [Oscillospiraceae bacterium]